MRETGPEAQDQGSCPPGVCAIVLIGACQLPPDFVLPGGLPGLLCRCDVMVSHRLWIRFRNLSRWWVPQARSHRESVSSAIG